MPTKQISEQFYNQDQSWNYERIVKMPSGIRLRIEIRRNAYDNQSHVQGYAFDPNSLKWNLLVNRPITTARCKVASYVQTAEKVNRSLFVADCEDVLAELSKIVE